MSHSIDLNEMQVENISNLAEEKRRTLGYIGETAIGGDIFNILERMGIILLKYPIKSESSKPAFSASIMYSLEGDKEFVFVGLNTADFFDNQVFAVAHELYHFYTKTGSHLSRLSEAEDNLIEVEANRFAAEFLLPGNILKRIILNDFKAFTLQEMPIKKILRFIARLQCRWWLPYRSIVKRLKEVNAISQYQYQQFISIDERNLDGEYGRTGQAINKDVFLKLNTVTCSIGASPKDIEVIIRNYEDKIIDEDNFTNTLEIFGKNAKEFGYEITATKEDADEFQELLSENILKIEERSSAGVGDVVFPAK